MNSQNTVMYLWNRLSFPLWVEVRPSSEMLRDLVQKTLKAHHVGTVFLYEQARVDGSEVAKDWLRWELPSSLTEERREKIQRELVEHFGEEARNFRWEGVIAVTTIRDIIAMGQFIQ